jgi:hypothetical protein
MGWVIPALLKIMNKKKIAKRLLIVAKHLLAEGSEVEEIEEIEPQGSKPVKERRHEAGWFSGRDAFDNIYDHLKKSWNISEDYRIEAKIQDDPESEKILKSVEKHIKQAMDELRDLKRH